jgi:tetratricopeptide (TPR) repeat protein
VPTGNKKFITKDELLERFSPEPEFYIQSVYPKMRELSETILRADDARGKGETFSAEFEYDTALKVDVDNVKANFGIGLTYLSRGETDKAENIFSRLVNLEAAFEEEHKHLFNDFGINLRKNKMLDQALDYYLRAAQLTTNDDNLYFNIARVYLEQKDMPKVVEYLGKSLEIAPKNEMTLKFLAWLEAKKMITPEQANSLSPKAQATPAAPASPEPSAPPTVADSPASPASPDSPASADDMLPLAPDGVPRSDAGNPAQ